MSGQTPWYLGETDIQDRPVVLHGLLLFLSNFWSADLMERAVRQLSLEFAVFITAPVLWCADAQSSLP